MQINRVRRLNAGRYGVMWGSPGNRHHEMSETLREELQAREWAAQDKKVGVVRPSNPKK